MAYKFKEILKLPGTREQLKLNGPVAILTYHAGTETKTGIIAKNIHQKSHTSFYKLKTPYHIHSTKISYTRSKKLKTLINNSKTAISIHGHNRNDRENTIFVTGQNKELVLEIVKNLEANKKLNIYEVESSPENTPKFLRGESSHNIINKFKEKGVQIELPLKLRKSRRDRKVFVNTVINALNNRNTNS